MLYNHQNELENNAEKVDVLLVPSATSIAPKLEQDKSGVEEYINDVMTLPASLAGIPAITVPFKTAKEQNEHPIGLQLLGQYGYDKFILHVAEKMMK